MKLEFNFPVATLCSIAGISRSAYYKYKHRSVKEKDDIEKVIIDIYNKSNQRAGYRTIKFILKNQYSLIVNHKKVYRLMKKNNMASIVRKKFKKPKQASVIRENILNRQFNASRPGKKFVTDITYIPTKYKMMYLCTVIDLFNNEPVAWKVSDCQDKNLSLDTIEILAKQYDLTGSIIHSDQGIHFTNKDFVALLEKLKVIQSMSRKGNCWDNAVAESFFSHYKCESIYLVKNRLTGKRDVEEITKEYMNYYTMIRPQKKLGGMPPSQYKETYMNH